MNNKNRNNKRNNTRSNTRNNMRNNKSNRKRSNINIKRVLLAILILLVIIFGCVKMCGSNGKGHKKYTYNHNKSFLKEQKVKGIAFEDIECYYDGKDSTIKYKMVNKSDEKVYLYNYTVLVQDKKKVVMTKIVAGVDETLAPKEEKKMANKVVGVDLSDAHYMKLELDTKKRNKED